MAAAFDPEQLTVTAPADGQLLLKITNSGNACDERYTMEFTSDPPGLTLTPETARFLVPPQKTAGINVTAPKPAAGTYTVHARVITDTTNTDTGCPANPAVGAQEATAHAVLVVNGPATETPTETPTDTPTPIPTDTALPTPTDTALPTPTNTALPTPTDTRCRRRLAPETDADLHPETDAD